MAANDLVKQYLRIPQAERSDVLEQLMLSLSYGEARAAQTALSNRHDPFHKLPIELVTQIFDFLHPYDTWSNRVVGRRWNERLSSELMVNSALKRLMNHDPADSGLAEEVKQHGDYVRPAGSELPPVIGLPLSPINELRHTQALRFGRPFSSVSICDNLAIDENQPWWPRALFQLKGKNVAYLQGKPRDCNKVILRDLISGKATTIHGEAREELSGLSLTSEVLAFTTYSGILYVVPLTALQDVRRASRMPSSLVHCLAGDRSVLACLILGKDEHTIVVHDAAHATTASFNITRESLPQGYMPTLPRSLIVDSASETIDLIFLKFEACQAEYCSEGTTYKARVGVKRFSFDGDVLDQHVSTGNEAWGHFIDVHQSDTSSVANKPHLRTFISNVWPAGEKGVFQMMFTHDQDKHHHVLYDTKVMTFTKIIKPSPCLDSPSDPPWGRLSIWKDHLYKVAVKATDEEIITTIKQPHDYFHKWQEQLSGHWCGGMAMHYLPSDHLTPRMEKPGFRVNFVQVNDSFAAIVVPGERIIQIFCFDERIVMHKLQPTELWSEPSDEKEDALPETKPLGKFVAFDRADCARLDEYKWDKIIWRMPKPESGKEEDSYRGTVR